MEIFSPPGTLFIILVASGSPSGSTPVEALLQAPWHLTIGEKSEEGLQEMTYVPRPKTALVAKNRVSSLIVHAYLMAPNAHVYMCISSS